MRALSLCIAARLVASGASAKDNEDEMKRAGAGRIEGEYIVVFEDDAPTALIPALAHALAGDYDVALDRVWTHALKAFSGRMTDARADGFGWSRTALT